MNILTFLLLFLAGVGLSSAWLTQNKKIDCVITTWGVWSGCILVSKGDGHYKERKRGMTQPKNGGKACPVGLKLRETTGCTRAEALATTFMSSLSSGKGNNVRVNYQAFSIASMNVVCPILGKGSNMIATGACIKPRTLFKRQTPVAKHRDLLLLLDESGSIGSTNYKDVKNLAAAVVSALSGHIAPKSDQTRIALATFDKVNHHKFNFNDYYDKPTLEHEIKSVKYSYGTSGRTCMTNALKYSRDSMYIPIRGIRPSSSTEKLIVMITDGCANCASSAALESMRKSLDNKDISVMILHIGSLTSCLDKLRALSDGSRCFQLYNLKSYDEVRDFAAALASSQRSSWQEFDMACKPINQRL